MTPSLQKQLANIHEAEQLLQSIRADIADSWTEVGIMLRMLRNSKGLTQADAALLMERDASIVTRWEKGCIASRDEVISYIQKLENV